MSGAAKQRELGPAECWFCLSNPKVTFVFHSSSSYSFLDGYLASILWLIAESGPSSFFSPNPSCFPSRVCLFIPPVNTSSSTSAPKPTLLCQKVKSPLLRRCQLPRWFSTRRLAFPSCPKEQTRARRLVLCREEDMCWFVSHRPVFIVGDRRCTRANGLVLSFSSHRSFR